MYNYNLRISSPENNWAEGKFNFEWHEFEVFQMKRIAYFWALKTESSYVVTLDNV